MKLRALLSDDDDSDDGAKECFAENT